MAQATKNSKRYMVDKDKTTVFALIAVASVVTIAAFVVSKGFWSQASYLSKVADIKETARDQLEDNKKAVTDLTLSYNALTSQNPNLLGGNPQGTGERDGDNAALILDALPSKYDFPALAASVEKILTGYSINSIAGVDDTIAQQTLVATGPVEIPFTTQVETNYDGFKQLISTFNRSIKPIHFTKLELSGTNAILRVSAEAKSYYQPELGLQITENEVQ
jgi:hypothetical protein